MQKMCNLRALFADDGDTFYCISVSSNTMQLVICYKTKRSPLETTIMMGQVSVNYLLEHILLRHTSVLMAMKQNAEFENRSFNIDKNTDKKLKCKILPA